MDRSTFAERGRQRENKSRYAILGALSLGPMSGYDVRRVMEQGTSNFWSESYGQIYPTLRQLEAEGLAERQTAPQAGRPGRHVYALTDRGWEELRRWLATPPTFSVGRSELLLKLFFGSNVPRAVNVAHVERFRATLEQLRRSYDDIQRLIDTRAATRPDLPYWHITLSYGRHVTSALLDWCDETLDALGRAPAPEAGASQPAD